MMDAKDFLQGENWWFGPVHPAIVHLPVGLWSAALVFDVISMVQPGNNAMVQTAFWCIVGGCVAAFLAVPFGFADWWDLRRDSHIARLGLVHLCINLIALLIFIVDFAIRVGHVTLAISVNVPQLICTIVGLVVVWTSVIIGGLMVYDHGANVARFNKSQWRARAVAAGGNVPEQE